MTAAGALCALARHGIVLERAGDRLRCEGLRGALTEDVRSLVRANREALLDSVAPPVQCRAPLSAAQCELVRIGLASDEGWRAYNDTMGLLVDGKIDRDMLTRSVVRLAERHEALRTRLDVEVEQQVIAGEVDRDAWAPVEPPWRGPATLDRALAWLGDQGARPFPIQQAPLGRLSLVEVEGGRTLVGLTLHHAISDGGSFGVAIAALAAHYSSLAAGEVPAERPVLQYRELLRAQAHEVIAAGGAHAEFWKARCRGPAASPLPYDRPAPATRSYRGRRLLFDLPVGERAAVEAAARSHGTTLAVVYLASYASALAAAGGLREVTVGVAASARTVPGAQTTIGFIATILPLSISVDGREDFAALVRRVHQAMFEALAYQSFHAAELSRALDLGAGPRVPPLISAGFNFVGALDLPPLAGLETQAVFPPIVATNFDLKLGLARKAGGLFAWCDYTTDLFDEGTVRRVVEDMFGRARAFAGQTASSRGER